MTGDLKKQSLDGPPGRFVSCYTASKLIHAPKLLALRQEWPRIYFTARWVAGASSSVESARPAAHWLIDNADDIIRSDTFLLYAEPEDVLKGAVWEAGIAWANGKDIWLVGDNPSYSKWKFAPRIHRAPTLERALGEINARTLYSASAENRIVAAIDSLDERVQALATDVKAIQIARAGG